MSKSGHFSKAILLCLIGSVLFSLTACNITSTIKEKVNEGIEECKVNPDNGTEFTYLDESYTVLNERVEQKIVKNRVGYIQKCFVLDNDYSVMMELSLTNLLNYNKDTEGDGKYNVTYNNIYETEEDYLAIDVYEDIYKAVKTDSLTSKSKVIQMKEITDNDGEPINGDINSGEVVVNESDCTQLIFGEKVYQIGDKEVSTDKLERYITIIGQRIVFDANTKKELSSKELKKIEMNPNRLSSQLREDWSYDEVYSIKGKSEEEEVAVSINNKFYKAKCIN